MKSIQIKSFSLIWWIAALTYGISVFWTLISVIVLGLSFLVGIPSDLLVYRLFWGTIIVLSLLASAHQSMTEPYRVPGGKSPGPRPK